ncbi:serine/threonine-protein kinase [Microbacterium album]|uniref:non-specific serine/threonine protein kinase n=1 Tax=Microbacterium album TaxID=2053191 RepID=A0A917IGR5_9MICO|nr:serine/threonine-protein kinase [Microbacterium album]GGH42244.1 serine/threonine protein kinase [Microbacterium album]
MSGRTISPPPSIPGLDHVRPLGKGGFADVYLYQQQHPRREVAVKALLKERLDSSTVGRFAEEANLMAMLASHPSIVSIYGAGVADDGRPYLVMEYCSRPNLQVRHQRERFSEAETLRIGVQIAGAVETAHRAGVLHRDIKPANILVTAYGTPALTDFGISATTAGEQSGLSVPWAPPEAFRDPPQGDETSDVYSLAATLYTLLTNRTPFHIPGASNTEFDIMSRIQTMALPPTGRSDVSPSLEAVLRRAMTKAPAERYASAMEFARALQRVQIELGMQETRIDVVEDELALAEEEDDDDGRTRFRAITSIDAQPAPAPAAPPARAVLPASSDAAAASGLDQTQRRPSARVPVAGPVAPEPPTAADTLLRSPAREPDAAPELAPATPRGRRWVAWASGIAVGVVAIGVGAAVILAPQGVGEVTAPIDRPAAPVDPIGDTELPPQITGLAGQPEGGEVAFTWSNPDPREGDTYLWRPVVAGESHTFEETAEPTAVVAADASGRACIEVVLRRANGTSAPEGVEGCAP